MSEKEHPETCTSELSYTDKFIDKMFSNDGLSRDDVSEFIRSQHAFMNEMQDDVKWVFVECVRTIALVIVMGFFLLIQIPIFCFCLFLGLYNGMVAVFEKFFLGAFHLAVLVHDLSIGAIELAILVRDSVADKRLKKKLGSDDSASAQ